MTWINAKKELPKAGPEVLVKYKNGEFGFDTVEKWAARFTGFQKLRQDAVRIKVIICPR